MVDTLTPALTALDRRVLAQLGLHEARRARWIAEVLLGTPRWRCDCCHRTVVAQGTPDRESWRERPPRRCWMADRDGYICDGMLHPMFTTLLSADQTREVTEILRGLERVGLAVCRGGWWRRTDEGESHGV